MTDVKDPSQQPEGASERLTGAPERPTFDGVAPQNTQVQPQDFTAPGVTEMPSAPNIAAVSSQSQVQSQPVTGRVTVKPQRPSLVPSFFAGVLGALIVCLVLAGVLWALHGTAIMGGLMAAGSSADVGVSSSSAPSAPLVSSSQGDIDLPKAVAEKAMPSVVSINVVAVQNGQQVQGVGSGVVYDDQGHIITNYHVVANAVSIVCNVAGQKLEGKIVGSDPSSDLAVVKVEGENLTPLAHGDSSQLKVGQWVMAIGSPYGYEQSASTGIVSSLFRSTVMPSRSGIQIYANLIQTDAAINPGNSGGALVDEQGRLVGINTLIQSNTGSSIGIGFAIPINEAVRVADQIIAGKPVEHAYLGVTLSTINPLLLKDSRFADKITPGAYVEDSISDGPADQGGIKSGDIITALDGEEIVSANDLILKVRQHNIGDEVTVSIVRDNKKADFKVTLGSDQAAKASAGGTGQLGQGQGQQGGDTGQGGADGSNQAAPQDQDVSPFNLFDLYQRFYNKQ